MTDPLSASPLVILAGLFILSWFTGSKYLKAITAGFFFFYPVILGKVSFPSDPDHVIDYFGDVLRYWVTQALTDLVNYIKQQIGLPI